MHKITKGLKKKKKGKKSKHKEDDLFKPEELEAYRREHQQQQQQTEGEESAANTGQNEEWRKFLALTSEVDDVLKKTQGDLNRIKSTSFFQRIPPASEVKKQEEQEAEAKEEEEKAKQTEEREEKRELSELGIVQVSESEEESEEDDDIFDTAYIDAIAAGEVKLAYIPESPTDQPDGDDPFDTSIAERAILGPAVERKGKKLVPIGAAVEVLTGRVQAPTCATKRPVPNRRQILKERDLLLGSFEDNANSIPSGVISQSPEEVKKTLLDDDAPLPDEPIDLSQSLYIPPVPTSSTAQESQTPAKDFVTEFDIISNVDKDEDDDEFALLAAESLNKPVKAVDILPSPVVEVKTEGNWKAFADEKQDTHSSDILTEELADPFDTTFAENILPGKAELKVIEDEVLNQSNDFEFDPRSDERISRILNKVTISVVEPTGGDSITLSDRVSESELNLIKPIHRDLLGGSNTDLSNLSDQPLQPAEKVDENYIEYCDPFDTSIVETAKLPGQAELKFIEKELLADIQKAEKLSLSDDEFDPRAEEEKPRVRTASRPDVLNIASVKTVSFDLPSPTQGNFLGATLEPTVKKPVTPFYVRKNSVPEEPLADDLTDEDPFDTSFVTEIAPGKAEIKLIESELFNPETERNLSISDQDFDPRNEKIVQIAAVVQTIKEISDPNFTKPPGTGVTNTAPIDLLATNDDIAAKVLTPAVNFSNIEEELSYSDPFDTSIACNILPGKTELKLIESELIHSSGVKNDIADPDFDPRSASVASEKVDLLQHSEDIVIHRPLSPVRGQSVSSFDAENNEDIDPFDTSIANNIGPGKTELKLIESELM